MLLPTSWSGALLVLRAKRAVRVAARRRRAQLRRELTCRTQRDRDDLLALFEQYPDGLVHEYREIVLSQPLPAPPGRRDWRAMSPR